MKEYGMKGSLGLLLSAAGIVLLACSPLVPDKTRTSVAEVATPVRDDSLSLAFVGDIMAHPINYAKRPYSAIYAAVTPVLHAEDLSFANLELTIDPARPYTGWPRFNVHPDYVEAAIEAGFNVFSNANNHIADYGETGIESTRGEMEQFARKYGIHFSGIRPEADGAIAPTTIELRGWKIGYLAITEFLNESRGGELVNLVDYRDPKTREQFLDYLRSVTGNYDLFILSVHGGIEYDLTPEKAKEGFFKEALNAGVSIVWSQHPHVLEPWEVVNVNGTRRLIIYSNGNFISGQTSEIDPATPEAPRAFTGDSAIFRVRVVRQPGGVSVVDVDPLLITNFKDRSGEMVVEPLEELVNADLPEPWRSYYGYRYWVMQDLLQGDIPNARTEEKELPAGPKTGG